jgi:geranylgeranylglycerol-phosphate geranylgeranyltransferase
MDNIQAVRQEYILREKDQKDRVSFFRSQLILLNSRKKFGLLYCLATVAGLFCVPGIADVMGSETEIHILIQKTLPLPLITFLIAVGMYILNDLIDVDLDKVNSKNRPIPSGRVSKKQAKSFVILTNGIAIALLIATFNPVSMLLVIPMMLIGIAYSAPKIALMNRFLIKNISIASFYMLGAVLGMTSSYGIDFVDNDPIVPLHIIAIFGIMIFAGSILNDLGDIPGDKAAGRRTVPIVFGKGNTVKMLVILLVSMPSISWILYGVVVETNKISMLTPITVSIVASLGLLRMSKLHDRFEDVQQVRKQHKKWFPLHMVLQFGLVIGALLPL